MHTFSETGPGVPAFLAKLWRLVEDPATDNLISWSQDGKSFIIQNQAQFARELLPLNYKHNNMASFIRQLNMYGFHKITSIDNGGLKFDRDDMEFSHAFFQRGYPYLLENIKRKIAHPKTTEEKSTIKQETVNKVLNEVKLMRGRQDTLDTRFLAMKQENEALWREIAVLRQKHMKQQQIVNKLIQFLVTIVQPQRGGLGSMGGKRHYQLMINDIPQSSKIRRTSHDTNDGPIIHEMSEDLLDECVDTEQDIEQFIPSTENLIENTENSEQITNDDGKQLNYIDDDLNENDYNPEDNENILTTPMVKKVMEKNSRRKSKIGRNGKSLLKNKQVKKEIKKNIKIENNNLENDNEINYEPSEIETYNQSNMNDEYSDVQQNDESYNITNIKREKLPLYTHSEDFMNAEMPNDIFDDENSVQSHPDPSPMIGGIDLNPSPLTYTTNVQEDSLNNLDLVIPTNSMGQQEQQQQQQSQPQEQQNQQQLEQCNESNKNDWALQSTKTMHPKDNLLKLHNVSDIDNHLENFQGELDSLKDLLRGEGLSVDANTLLGLFSDSDILAPYGLSMTEKKAEGSNFPTQSYGSEIMTYNPSINCDLSELLDEDNIPQDSIDVPKDTSTTSSSVLNTPIPEKEFNLYKTKKF